MAVFRVERNKGYTVMSNHHLRNKDLSLKAKGLLSQMLSLPEDWDYTIEQLHTHDWAVFNSDRRYYRRLQDAGTYLEKFAEDTAQPEVKTVEDFLDSIENQQLYQILIMVDRLTLQIIVMKIQGYSTHEIASRLNTTRTEKLVQDGMDG